MKKLDVYQIHKARACEYLQWSRQRLSLEERSRNSMPIYSVKTILL